MHLRQFPLNGQLPQLTLTSFVALVADLAAAKPNKFGSIGDRPSSLITTVANGRNFINAIVDVLGGLGVAIARLRSFLSTSQILKPYLQFICNVC